MYGQNVSRIAPRTYAIIFVCCDLLSLILQAAGGALTATADKDQPDLRNTGVNIMIAGLATQVASLAVFILLCAEFAYRVVKNKHRLNESFEGLRKTKLWKLFLFGELHVWSKMFRFLFLTFEQALPLPPPPSSPAASTAYWS